jgi:glucose/arabinose dehydrogenase
VIERRRGDLRGSRRRAIAIAVVMLVAAACSGDLPTSTPTRSTPTETPTSNTPASPSPDPSPSGPANLAAVRIRLVQVASVEQPVALAVRPGDPALYVAEKTGRVVAIREGRVAGAPVVDLTGRVSLGTEQGLLGLAFSPDGRFLYVNYTDVNGHTHVTEFGMSGGTAARASERDVLVVEQPFVNHNGGNLAFGPDGHLYIGLGDGGSGGDPNGNGQSLSALLGKMLRIIPRPTGGLPYGIPPDNPFADRQGARPEIWALGLRNPWRYSFDRATGDLWIGDVGQNSWEEISVERAGSDGGANFGWNILEGSHAFAGDEVPGRAIGPVFEYPHAEGGCTVIGGYVYRGRAIPALRGAYVFGDLCIGELEAIRMRNGRVTGHRVLGPVVENLSSFGEDGSGELYALSLSGGVYRLAPGG